MGPAILIVLSNLATMFLTAWLLHRAKTGMSPAPSMPGKVAVHSEPVETQPTKGRPIL